LGPFLFVGLTGPSKIVLDELFALINEIRTIGCFHADD